MADHVLAETLLTGYVAPILTVTGRRRSARAARRSVNTPNVIELPQAPSVSQPPQWAPAVNVFDTGGAFVVIAELAGVGPDSLRIELDTSTDRLTLRGTRSTRSNGESVDKEISSGHFERAIAFDAPVDADGARAICRYGLLELMLPKLPQRVWKGEQDGAVRSLNSRLAV